MRAVLRVLRSGWAVGVVLAVVSCGGGDPPGSSGSSSGGSIAAGSNVLSVVVDSGPTSTSGSVNTLFTTVTVCVPGSTTECQTIDHIQVDTGSYGLRILAPVLTLSLPVTSASDGNALAECTQFVDGYSWGPIASADVQLSGETAGSVPIQAIGSSNFATVPADCSSTGPEEDTVAAFGANGILGIGVFEQDCGSGCVGTAVPGGYYSCPQTGACVSIAVALAAQVQNPVALFAADNNGTIIDLPTVTSPGAATVTGSLIFGIDTRSNNASGTQTVLTVDPDAGQFTVTYKGVPLDASFIDSGTNGIYFNDSSIAACTDASFSGFYCPASTQNLTATLTGENGANATADFGVDNAQTVSTDNASFTALPGLAGTYPTSSDTFDFGLSFYYGRRVATALENHTTAVNSGPYIAF